ncbi:PTS sugar transporter subunit IIC [Endozoicomonas sp. Mp262]|uniref:PTS transporter subunit IIC n=1 Tax=Endozoicomonas sp. Mp262 TaxID=2919499 RepID=UPI0021D997F8
MSFSSCLSPWVSRLNDRLSLFGSTLVRVLNGMAAGLFSSLIIGLILKQLGGYSGLALLSQLGAIAQYMMGPAIGAGVALSLNAPPLIVVSALACGAMGAGTVSATAHLAIGDPAGALVAALAGTLAGLWLWDKTRLNMILVPAFVLIVGGGVGFIISPVIAQVMAATGAMINAMTHLHPVPMGILVSASMGILLTLPVSSAAIAISLGLSGFAAGAATVGCACHMIGFAVTSYKDNGYSGLIAQGLGTSMLQIGNIVRNPWISVAPILSSIVLGPLATTVFLLENSPVGAGMGTAGLVGPLAALETMGTSAWGSILLMCFALPAAISLVIHQVLKKTGRIKAGDMAI